MKLYRLFTTIFIIQLLCYQSVSQVSSAVLKSSNITAAINGNGVLFKNIDSAGTSALFEINGFNIASAIFQSNLWLAAKDQNDSLYVSADLYDGNDFFEGTINNVGKSSVQTFMKVKRSTIEYHKKNYNNPGYVVPPSILNWPAIGDTLIGEAMSQAPFIDFYPNGCYEPAKGDYPLIKGDEAVYFIINDVGGTRTSSGGKALGMEIHVMAYSYSSEDLQEVNSSLLVDYSLRNYSGRTYDSLFIGQFIDFDIGCAADDYVGTDTANGVVYAYNGAAFDKGCSGGKGFGAKPPAAAVGYFYNGMNSSMYFNSSNGPQAIQDPTSPIEFKNYLNSKWRDGSPLLKGGTGHIGDSTAKSKTKYMYSGNPLSKTGWNEINAGNLQGDRRAVIAMKPFRLFFDKQSVDFTVIYSSAYDSSAINYLSNIEQAVQNVTATRGFLRAQSFPNKRWSKYACFQASVSGSPSSNNTFKVYPNPSTGTIKFESEMSVDHVYIFSACGIELRDYSLEEGDSELVLDLPQGTYFLKYKLRGGSEGISRFILLN